ncbi:MAG: hypothetical protein J6U25_03805, partial [Clostridia bacterium]|nr:hypothetical protein [Clostridia bacterium]
MMLLDHIKNLTSEPSKVWLKNIRDGVPTAAFGVCDGAKRALSALPDKRVLYVAKDRLSAMSAREEFFFLTGKKSVYMPAKDDVLLYKKFFNKDNYYDRIAALYSAKDATFVTTTIEALLQLIPKTIPAFTLSVNEEFSLDKIAAMLVEYGYRRIEFAIERGSFALRGDILEIFPINSDIPFRFDFFGDELERIRSFDVETRKAEDEIDS